MITFYHRFLGALNSCLFCLIYWNNSLIAFLRKWFKIDDLESFHEHLSNDFRDVTNPLVQSSVYLRLSGRFTPLLRTISVSVLLSCLELACMHACNFISTQVPHMNVAARYLVTFSWKTVTRMSVHFQDKWQK